MEALDISLLLGSAIDSKCRRVFYITSKAYGRELAVSRILLDLLSLPKTITRLNLAANKMSSSDIAVVGLACCFSGEARSPEAFHQMLVKGRDAWSEVPSSRYDAKAFQHPSRERCGTTVR